MEYFRTSAARAHWAARRRAYDRLLRLRAPAQDADVEEAPDWREQPGHAMRNARQAFTRDLVQEDPAATATLSDSTPGASGMATRRTAAPASRAPRRALRCPG